MMPRLRLFCKMTVWMLLALWLGASGSARAQGSGSVTGRYEKDGGELLILEGDNETLVRYEAGFEQGNSVGSCECPLVVKQKSGERWTLQGAGSSDTWSLKLEPTRLVLEGKTPACCGMGWPGTDTFERSAVRAPSTCKVKADRANFFDSQSAATPRKAYVVAGDTVEVFLPGSEPRRVPARFKGPRKSTVGLLERAQLDCPQPGAPQAARPPVEAQRLRPFAGKWLELTRKGRGFVLFKPCAANTRSFTVRPASGELEVELGQETTVTKVVGLRPGPAGSQSLEVMYESGTLETVGWKELDARKGLVSVKSPELFSQGREYVREDRKSAYPVQVETGCDEER
ncbi:MAG TPA: hypothetical protein VFZ09_14625 [Archangium sp.]|uniref:hypothetical protein n=1 Tax=Archangium sp. TaxID=1872627 RepID=UPI002E2FD738|nr:hypothetical protein [Archangium sp.]HEX5747477.1 hypothetical protein [Archangium sp.]